jgi:hypothetical protein
MLHSHPAEPPAADGPVPATLQVNTAGHDSGTPAPPEATAAAQLTQSQLPLYQRLYAVLLLSTLRRALGEWDAAACSHHLGQLLPSLPQPRQQQQQQQQQQQEAAGPAGGREEGAAVGAGEEGGALGALGAGAGAGREAVANGSAAPPIPQDTPAQQVRQVAGGLFRCGWVWLFALGVWGCAAAGSQGGPTAVVESCLRGRAATGSIILAA